MRLLLLPLLLVLPGIGPASAGDLARGLVGFSTATFTGDAGVLAMTVGCQVDFPTSRMCTSEEVLQTQKVPSGLVGTAWVRPVLTSGGTSNRAVDASGVDTSSSIDLSCLGWSAIDQGSGLSVDAEGAFGRTLCSVSLPVACCAVQADVIGDFNGNTVLDLADSVIGRRLLAGQIVEVP